MKRRLNEKKKAGQRPATGSGEESIRGVPPCEEPSRCHGFHVMVKPIGPQCNLRCKYCFYLEKKAMFPAGEDYAMPDDVLESHVQRYIRACAGPEVNFAWQGGEPTMLGVEFFKRVVELQNKHSDGRPISNSLQTNGVLLDDEWCEFFAREDFLVGLSIDGPRRIHDRHRVKADGSGSFDDVMRGLKCLQKHGVEFNSLTCIPRGSAGQGRDIYKFLRNCGIKYMQFIPIVERAPGRRAEDLDFDLDAPPYREEGERNQEVMSFTVEPEQYGKFLIDIFKYWIRRDVGKIFVNHFDNALAGWVGQEPGLCVYAKECGNALAMEHNGDVYTCDHFVYPEYYLGNVKTASFDSMIMNPMQHEFRKAKSASLPTDCRDCRYLQACNGGCPKHRFLVDSHDEPGLNYLCKGFKKFYAYADPYLARMAALLKAGRSPAEIMRE